MKMEADNEFAAQVVLYGSGSWSGRGGRRMEVENGVRVLKARNDDGSRQETISRVKRGYEN